MMETYDGGYRHHVKGFSQTGVRQHTEMQIAESFTHLDYRSAAYDLSGIQTKRTVSQMSTLVYVRQALQMADSQSGTLF